jgi:hypothetical protein
MEGRQEVVYKLEGSACVCVCDRHGRRGRLEI